MAVWAKQKLMRLSRGYYNRSKNCFRITIRRVFKALQYQYADRRIKKREIRTSWIQSINAACRDVNVNYSRFIYSLNRSNMNFDRKILANLAQYEPFTFKAILDEAMVQVNPPNMSKGEPIDYKEAIQRKLLYFGPFTGDNKPVKDKELRFLEMVDKTKPDWFGMNRPDFPDFYKDAIREDKKNQMKKHEMKRQRFTAYDDIPSEPDDDV